ncbi:MAG: M23 family metallopeptidase [Alphaproteobacteria bacterium]|nr:M23 family metallopeptidase [Alphaproteobacteria bacterium]
MPRPPLPNGYKRALGPLVCVLLLAAPPVLGPADAQSGRTIVDGTAVQGGLVTGRTQPGARLRLGDRAVPVGRTGRFAFGFGRDAGPAARLHVAYADGASETIGLAVGQRQYDEQRIDGVAPRFVDPPAGVAPRIAEDRRRVGQARAGFRDVVHFLQTFKRPAPGPVTGVYGSRRIFNGQPRRPHSGLDIGAPEGTPVLAPAAGRVTLVRDLYFSGNTVILDHGHGVFSTFLHMSAVEVEEGAEVAQGAPIGRVGATGRVTGPHLHWALNWYGVRLDPALLLER